MEKTLEQRIGELEKKVAVLERQVQEQPVEKIIDKLYESLALVTKDSI
ncbi:hypothetical protein SAMN05660297_02780 [Natronincola peptidivorans]|uniref:Uncharacterized protein n=1 Tax=Natronincola peptidivorans TaxID=426128 RepID=A0A1I0FFQ2_9FIRM|nr:hypothetical protein [Natronincola peptidivorans]SET56368.1 hypothetical protein SAMN05660297_02780 [Natronincola peptidivorans]